MPTKTGLSYYTVDTDRYMDIRIKRLKRNMGCAGLAVYDYLLCEIYRVRGCFTVWDENTAFDVAECLGLKERVVREIVRYCGAVGLFDKGLLAGGIITSASIQRRYLDMCQRAKRRVSGIPAPYDLTGGGSQITEVAPQITEMSRKITEDYGNVAEDYGRLRKCRGKRKEKFPPDPFYKEKENKKEKEREAGEKSGKPDFRTLSVEEVRIYLDGAGLTVTDPADFLDYYNTVGWMEKTAPVTDWRAAARRWNARELRRGRGPAPSAPPKARPASVSPATIAKMDAGPPSPPANGIGGYEAYCRAAGVDPAVPAAELAERMARDKNHPLTNQIKNNRDL